MAFSRVPDVTPGARGSRWDEALRVATIDVSAARAAVIEEGLCEAGLTDITMLTERRKLAAALEALAPDVVLMDLALPSRDLLEESFMMSRALARPIAMVIDQSDEDTIGAAIDTGALASVVDGLRRERIKPILDLAIKRSMPSRAHRPNCTRRARHSLSAGRWTGRRRS